MFNPNRAIMLLTDELVNLESKLENAKGAMSTVKCIIRTTIENEIADITTAIEILKKDKGEK